MPLQYAIEEKHPTIKHGPGSREYFIVSHEIAETNDNGCYALFNDEGEQVSHWSSLHRKQYPQKPSTRSFVKDSMKQTVVEGDYVGYNNSGGMSPIVVGKVVGFTNKQVRVLRMGMNAIDSPTLMYESSLIKLPESFWHGTL
jgi:hypothetical protein